MYNENETLILQQNVGKEDTESFIPKGTEVTFVKAMDNPRDLSKAIVVINYQGRIIPLPELAVAPKKQGKTVSALKEFNKQLMENRPELKVYHHNIFMRLFYRLSNLLYRLFVNPIIVLYKKLTTPTPAESSTDKVVQELKKLMNEEK